MARMAAPYTGVIHEVAPSRVAARLAAGFRLIDVEVPAEPAVEEPEPEPVGEAPTAESTIAEIKSWAKANGVDLPAKANKAALLAAIEGAV